MDEFLRKFDTIRFVAPWSIFRNFWEFFIFLNLNLNFEFGPVWYRPKPKPGQTGLTGNRSNRTGSHRFGEPWLELGRGGGEIPISRCDLRVALVPYNPRRVLLGNRGVAACLKFEHLGGRREGGDGREVICRIVWINCWFSYPLRSYLLFYTCFCLFI